MLTEKITYEDFNGNERTEEFYFNISKTDLSKLEVEYQEGMVDMLKKIIETNDRKEMYNQLEKIFLWAYGVKSEDGTRFSHSQELRDAFVESAAYPVLFMKFFNDDDSASKFLLQVLPKDWAEIAKQAMAEQKKKEEEEAAKKASEEGDKAPATT